MSYSPTKPQVPKDNANTNGERLRSNWITWVVGALAGSAYCFVNAFKGIFLANVVGAYDPTTSDFVQFTGAQAHLVGFRWLGGAMTLAGAAYLFFWLYRRD